MDAYVRTCHELDATIDLREIGLGLACHTSVNTLCLIAGPIRGSP